MAERITTIAEVRGQVDDLKRKLADGERAVKKSADTINRTKAEFKVTPNFKEFDRQFNTKMRDIDRQLRAAERQQAARAAGGGRVRESTGQTLIRKFGTSSGTDPFLNAIGSIGPQAAAGLAITKVAELGIAGANQILDERAAGRAAFRTGNLEPVLEAQKRREETLGNIPIVGGLGREIRDLGTRLDGSKEELDILKEQTAIQDKLVAQMEQRNRLSRESREEAERTLRTLKEQAETDPRQRNVLRASAMLEDETKRQGALPAAIRDPSTLTGQALAAVSEQLGTQLGQAIARRSRGAAFDRTRAFVAQQEEERQQQETTQEGFRNRRARQMRERYAYSRVVAEEEERSLAEGTAIREGLEGNRQRRHYYMRQGFIERQREADDVRVQALEARRQTAHVVDRNLTDLSGRFTGATEDDQKAYRQRDAVIRELQKIERKVGGPAVTS